MYKVSLKGEIIAIFSEKSDADAYVEYKHSKLTLAFSQAQIDRYLQEHPYTRYGTKTLPGDIPLAATYPEYEAYSDSLRREFVIEPEEPELELDREKLISTVRRYIASRFHLNHITMENLPRSVFIRDEHGDTMNISCDTHGDIYEIITGASLKKIANRDENGWTDIPYHKYK